MFVIYVSFLVAMLQLLSCVLSFVSVCHPVCTPLCQECVCHKIVMLYFFQF
jgi:hypothetical protein